MQSCADVDPTSAISLGVPHDLARHLKIVWLVVCTPRFVSRLRRTPFSYTFSLFYALFPIFIILHSILNTFLASSPPSSFDPLSPCVTTSPFVLSSMSLSDLSSPPHLAYVPLNVIPFRHIPLSFAIPSIPPLLFFLLYHSASPHEPFSPWDFNLVFANGSSSSGPTIRIGKRQPLYHDQFAKFATRSRGDST